MSIVNLIMALLVMAGLWVAIVKALAASIRHADRVQATALPVAKAAPWRSLPANRPPSMPSSGIGPANSRPAVDLSTMKDLLA